MALRIGKTAPGPPQIDDRVLLCRNRRLDDTRLVKVLGASALLPVTGRRDQRVAAIAAVQRGRVSYEQLMQAGLTRHMVANMVTGGRLLREHQGVYAVGHGAEIPLARETAALLASGPRSALSVRTAGRLWGLSRPDENSPVDVTLLGQRRTRGRKGITVHRSRLITHRDVLTKDGLPLTSPAWTLLDLAESGTHREVERALEEALARRLVSLTKLREALGRAKRRGGGRLLAGLVADRAHPTLTRSEAEEQMLALIRAADLPPPQLNVEVCGYEFDFHWPEHWLVVEVDGFAWHAGRAAFERDRRKGIALAGVGIELVRVSWRQIRDDSYALVAGLAVRLART
jgi:very-short-patch-repair endonuclease